MRVAQLEIANALQSISAMRKKPEHHLQLRVRELGQLFNSMDLTPFLNKNLDREAEAFIETWAAEFPSDSRLRITIHLEHLPAAGDPSAIMIEAIHNYFDHKAGLTRSELNTSFEMVVSAR